MSTATDVLPSGPQYNPAEQARNLVRSARKGALATVDVNSQFPYASLVVFGTEPDGSPILLLSKLALHTRNLVADRRASVLIDASNAVGDPLTGARVTLVGRIEPAASTTAARRYLARNPSSAGYAGFADFNFFVLRVEWAHFIGGFGRIVTLKTDEILTDMTGAEPLVEAEAALLDAINEDAAPRLSELGERLSGRAGRWRVTGIDPAGFDLVSETDDVQRCLFPQLVTRPEEALQAIAAVFRTA